MTELIPCSEYDSHANKCRSGHMQLHPVCRGALGGCPTCGATSKEPICMRDDVPPHLIRENGMPLGWPDRADQGEQP